MTTFTRRQRVRTLYQHSETATIVGQHPEDAITSVPGDEWYVVAFDLGGGGSIHASMMAASNEPPFKGRLMTYKQSQRA